MENKSLYVQPDPTLQLTPEKPPIRRNMSDSFPIILSDASLQLTPEKKSKKNLFKEPTAKEVRFCLPENHNCSLESSKEVIKDKTQESPSVTSVDDSFSPNISSSTCTTDSNDSVSVKELSFTKAASLNFFGLREKTSKDISVVKNNKSIRPTKTSLNKKGDCIQNKINNLTRPKKFDESTLNSKLSEPNKKSFLKKREGLKRYTHAKSKTLLGDQNSDNQLHNATYHSSLLSGQQLQILKSDDFDALEEVIEDVENDFKLKNQVTKLASVATNICPKVQTYNNLIGLDVSELEIVSNHEWRHLKRPTFKPVTIGKNNIHEMNTDDIIKQTCIVQSTSSKTSLDPLLSPISSVMLLYNHSICWEETK